MGWRDWRRDTRRTNANTDFSPGLPATSRAATAKLHGGRRGAGSSGVSAAPAPPEDTVCRQPGTSAPCGDESAPETSRMRDERGWVFHPITVRPGRDLNPGQKLRKLLGYPLPYRDLFGVVLRYMSVDSINMYGSAEGWPASALRPPGMDQTRCELLEIPYRRSRRRTARGFVGPGTRFAEPRATPCSGRNSTSRLVFRMSASVFNNL